MADEKCPMHRLNSAKHYKVYFRGELVREDDLACEVCIGNTPWLEYRLIEVRKKDMSVPNSMVAASAEKYE